MTKSSQAESYCVDGDIKLVAGETKDAALSFLQAHKADPVVAKEHVVNLTDEQRDSILEILHKWTKPQENRSKAEVAASPDQVWEFIFCLDPEAVETCFSKIKTLFEEKCYQQVVDSCTAVLRQYPLNTAPLLLQRGLARTLMGNNDKEAVSDYLRSFLKDKEVTIQVVQQMQDEHVASVKQLMKNCVYSKSPPTKETKAYKQWLALTVDCSRFFLTFEPNDFSLQMTFVERLQAMHKTDRAIVMLTETLVALQSEKILDLDKITETLLRRGQCHLTKNNNDKALGDLTEGLNTRSNYEKKNKNNEQYSVDVEFESIQNQNEETVKIAKKVFGEKTITLADLYIFLDKSALKLMAEDKSKTVIKLENIRLSIEYYKAMLVLQPGSKDALFKLANCYARFGKNKLAIKIYDKLLEDQHFSQDSAILTARATCYRELGNKVEAQKDYDALLRNNPRDVILLCERAMVFIEDDDVESAVNDLMVACSCNQKLVVSQMNKEPLVHRTRTRQILFDHAKSMLLGESLTASGTDIDSDDIKNYNGVINTDTSSVALGISQLLTKLNPADLSSHILMSHAMFHAGCTNDAETKLKKMVQNNNQGIDIHVIKLHLGMMKVFTKRQDEGMADMMDVLKSKGERVVSSLLRDIPVSERAKLSDESHQYGIELLQKKRDSATVTQAVHAFTLALLFCRGTDLVLEGLNGGTGVYRSYLARAECMAHIGDQKAAILDFSAAIEVNPQCVDGLCGRAFMRLALGEENECIHDITMACDLDLYNVVAHIQALPDEAKKIILFWIDHRVVVLLLNYGYRSSDRLNTGGSASTISMLDETVFKPGEDVSRTSSLSSIHPPTPPAEAMSSSNPSMQSSSSSPKKLHKSQANAKDLNEALISLDNGNVDPVNQQQQSRGSTATTSTSYTTYDDVLSGMEKIEILHKSLLLGKLLITVESGNANWHGMYADILIVKGDYEEALRHLQVVMEITPNDVTATARAGLINLKMNQYRTATRLLSSLANVENSGLKYVLKAVDVNRKRRLAEEAFTTAEAYNVESKYRGACDFYSLSIMADSHGVIEKLRMRSRCFAKIGSVSKAIQDISDVIKEVTRNPQASDYCLRASFYLIEGKDFQACRDFMKAIEVERNKALSLIYVKPGRSPLCDIFYKQAFAAFSRRNYQECSDMCDVALIVDESNIDLRKLRARAKRELSKCTIQ